VPDVLAALRQGETLALPPALAVEEAELDLVALAENSAKFVPRPSQVAPSGCGAPARAAR